MSDETSGSVRGVGSVHHFEVAPRSLPTLLSKLLSRVTELLNPWTFDCF
jgi:hypothetical protein